MGQINRILQFGGLDTRTNKLTRQPNTASDCRNVYKNSNGDLIKKPDFDALNIPRAAVGERAINQTREIFEGVLPPLAEIQDFIKYEDHIFIVTIDPERRGNQYFKYYEDTETLINVPCQFTQVYNLEAGHTTYRTWQGLEGRLSSIVQEGILYFTAENINTIDDVGGITNITPDGIAARYNLSYVFAYDGKCVSMAGSFNPFTTENDGGTLQLSPEEYIRLMPIKIDYTGRVVLGNYSTHKSTHDGATNPKQSLTLAGNTIRNTTDIRRYYCGCQYKGVATSITEGDTIDVEKFHTITGSKDSSVVIGQYLYNVVKTVTNPSANEYVESYEVYRIEVVDFNNGSGAPATITVDNFEIYDEVDGGFVQAGPNMDITPDSYLSNHIVAVYASDDFNIGHTFRALVPYIAVGDFTVEYNTTKSGSTTNVTYNQPLLNIGDEFEDFYDEETVKLPPPRVRHIVDYLGAIALVDHKSLYFSDISIGGNIETFTPFDNFQVGSDKRGLITGVFANETFIAVFREEEAYYITGNIFNANYRIQSYQSTRIGCTDPRSIVDFRGAGMFLSKRGFYFAQQGGAMPELSDAIETIFTDGALGLDLDLTKCKGVVDFSREYIFFHITSNTDSSGYIVCFSYYFNEWYLWGGTDADGGFQIIDSKLYHSDGTNIYREASSSKDSLAYWRSNFETLGEPSFEKKFLQVLLYTIDLPEAARIVIKTYRDWKTDKWDTKEGKRAKANQVDLTQRFNPTRSKSLAIEIESPSGQALHLNGFEYEVEADVRMFKDDDQ